MKTLSLDWWSVILALGAAGLIRMGAFPHIAW